MNEIKRQLKMKIGDTTQHQRNVVRKIQQQNPGYSKTNKSLFPTLISIAVLAATIIFVFSIIGEESTLNTTTSANLPESITMVDSSSGEIVELDYSEYIGFLNYIIENNYGKQEDVLSTLKYKPINNEFSPSYLVTFDCGKAVCASAYISLVDTTISTFAPLGEGRVTSELIYSPNQENVMFLLSNSEKTKQRIVVINLESSGESRIPTLHHEYFSSFSWPITSVQWITDDKVKVTFADLEEPTDKSIKEWEENINKPTKTIEVPLPNRHGAK
ncbi:hypothetical protein [Ureibacillus sinduriensis]|uniref:Uncharacterized protein n=1 Tax=Ureibacillus sinduriensis BLB-1 = JCM 15800 TaxID=1384057 RepID=A0A0A3HY70_9BACL|nr:hypothetical protein [Ureibacillus sinduriensis]KGR76185.1 hypothetical protein CD33_08480 [Ureibacillus sinduriensis BLB-1 = JCM 15800]